MFLCFIDSSNVLETVAQGILIGSLANNCTSKSIVRPTESRGKTLLLVHSMVWNWTGSQARICHFFIPF